MTSKRRIDIHKLIHWALVRECVEHVARLQRQAFAPPKPQGFATNMAVMELGTHVSSPTMAENVAGAKCHEDALTVLEGIHRLPFEAQVVVIKCGRVDCCPDFAPEGVGKLVQVMTRHGNPKKLWENPTKQRGFLGYATEWQGLSREEVNFYRSEYRLWREALLTS